MSIMSYNCNNCGTVIYAPGLCSNCFKRDAEKWGIIGPNSGRRGRGSGKKEKAFLGISVVAFIVMIIWMASYQ